ncbi:hypothetical protein NP233_g2862 [Leucocoprinus birnbaumii]|uniref:F-box domain-containing protein n=1 Tax=Leucocoprinus birnbaumii TaxID=56174 RepID=A0AAD5W3V1_9AGAR|nr:hypothetical protein NP233_g2862 [Leucocoprinus birnbaumii]
MKPRPPSSMHKLEISLSTTPLLTEQELDDIVHGCHKISHAPIARTDLPPELWKQILSYLPRGTVGKMIGINRMLFELGMNELYGEVLLMDYRGAGLKTFQQIRNSNIASRVYSLHIQPSFLLRMSCKGKPMRDMNENRPQRKKRKSDIRAFLDTALTSISDCAQLRQLNVIIHDQCISNSLAKFLQKLFKRVGRNLESLTIDMTLPSFLSIHHVFNPKLLPRLSTLIIKINDSRGPTSKDQARRARKALHSIIQPLNATLHILAFEVINFNLSKIFQKLEQLPKLHSLELRAEVGFSTLIPTIHFVTFLKHNADNLERLVIRRPTVDVPSSWNLEAIIGRLYNLLCVQHLPKLKELVLEVDYTSILESLTTHVRTFVPHLKNLTLTGQRSTLDHVQLSSLLHGLGGGDSGLESLKISVSRFSPEHLELFSTSLPNLKRLDLSYSVLWMNNRSLVTQTGLDWDATIYEDFRTRTYPQWKLEDARIVQVDETIPTLRRVVRTRDCECRW